MQGKKTYQEKLFNNFRLTDQLGSSSNLGIIQFGKELLFYAIIQSLPFRTFDV